MFIYCLLVPNFMLAYKGLYKISCVVEAPNLANTDRIEYPEGKFVSRLAKTINFI